MENSRIISIVYEKEAHDDDIEAYKKVKELVARVEDVAGIFISAGGITGAVRAVEELGLGGRVTYLKRC